MAIALLEYCIFQEKIASANQIIINIKRDFYKNIIKESMEHSKIK